MPNSYNLAILAVYLVIGLYLLNIPFQFITIPESVLEFEPWILFAGGILLVISSFRYISSGKTQYPQVPKRF